METKKYDLENRLIQFACMCLDVCELFPNTKVGINLEYHLAKSATAPALIYGEAQAAESRSDFIHKMKLALKELRESRINLRITVEKPIIVNEKVNLALREANELIGIFTTSIETAQRNLKVSNLSGKK